MASRLAVLALLLVCVVWGSWLSNVATARVEGEVNIFTYFLRHSFSTTSVESLTAMAMFAFLSARVKPLCKNLQFLKFKKNGSCILQWLLAI